MATREQRKIWKKDFAVTDWSAIELNDWIEGAGLVDSMFTRDLVRNIGATLTRGIFRAEAWQCPVCGQELPNRVAGTTKLKAK